MMRCLLLFVSVCYGVWPALQSVQMSPDVRVMCPNDVKMQISASNANVVAFLQRAVTRFTAALSVGIDASKLQCGPNALTMRIFVTGNDDPKLDSTTDESYILTVGEYDGFVSSSNVFGVLHGLESFVQYLNRSSLVAWTLPVKIYATDAPRFPFRSVMHDSARHFLSIPILKKLIDAMAMAKFNVFHWHVLDNESCPYSSIMWPNITNGAFGGPNAGMIYSDSDIQDLVQFAFDRGVRVVPEFESPGQCRCLAQGYPDILTQCFNLPGNPRGLMDPTKNATFDFLAGLYLEASKRFPDDVLHIGGDDVEFSCWQSNPNVQAFVQSQGWGNDYARLEEYFARRAIKLLTNKSAMIWQDMFEQGVDLDRTTIVDVLKNSSTYSWKQGLANVTSAGYRAVLSAPWFLNFVDNPYPTKGWRFCAV